MSAAIQFVVSDRAVARQNYVTSTQALILFTGCCLLLAGLQSILCYYIHNWNRHNQHRKASGGSCDACQV